MEGGSDGDGDRESRKEIRGQKMQTLCPRYHLNTTTLPLSLQLPPDIRRSPDPEPSESLLPTLLPALQFV